LQVGKLVIIILIRFSVFHHTASKPNEIMSDQYIIQVLKKKDHTSQHLVPIPSALPALAAKSVRVKSTLISLTRNNITYARLGHVLNWWDVHPLPPTIPSEFADAAVYGRISAWGYGTIIESNIDALKIGSEVWGYLPIGTLPVDLILEPAVAKGQWIEKSQHRAHLLNGYNRYIASPAPKPHLDETEKISRAYDSLMQVLFETGFNLSRSTFAWGDRPAVHPFTGATFSAAEADISDAIILITPAGSKTALSFAQQLLAGGRPAEFQPRRIIGIGSQNSKSLAVKSGFYDQLLDYSDVEGDVMEKLGVHGNITKAVFCDVGSRPGAAKKWVTVLKSRFETVLPVVISSSSTDPADAVDGAVRVNASVLRDSAMKMDGEEAYMESFTDEWSTFKENGGIRGMEIQWGSGMTAVGDGWDKLCKGEVGPEIGLVYDL
jgi:hypothetical protein